MDKAGFSTMNILRLHNFETNAIYEVRLNNDDYEGACNDIEYTHKLLLHAAKEDEAGDTALSALFIGMSSGMHYGWSSAALPKLLSKGSHIPISNGEASWITTSLLCGTVCGAILTGIMLDTLGRKVTLSSCSVPFFISWLLIAFSNNVFLLITGRFIGGIGDGLLQCTVPIYIGEISDPKIRGVFGSAISIFWFSGMLFSNVIGSFLSIKVAALISSSIPVIFIVIFFWMPDSPYYLFKKGKNGEAINSLKLLCGKEDVTVEVNRIHAAILDQKSSGSRYSDIFNSAINRKALFLMLAMRTIQQACGVISIMFYAQIIIKQSSANSFSPEIGSIIYFSMYIVFLGVCSALIDTIGRKPLLIFSIMGSGIALLIESLYLVLNIVVLPWIPIATIIAYAIFFSLGMQSIPIVLQGELFPINIKAKAVSIYLAYFALVSAVTFKIFQVTSEKFGLHVPLFFFSASCLIGLFYIIYFVPETKGKTLEEIQDELKGHKEKNCMNDSPKSISIISKQ